MLLKLAFKNLKAKITNTILVIVAITVMTAMAYAIISFRSIVNEFVSQHEISTKCGSDITVVANQFKPISEARLNPNKYKQMPALSIYPNMGGTSVNARGMKKEDIEQNKSIEMYKGKRSIENPDGVIVSKSMAKKNKLDIGSKIELELGGIKREYYVVGIAKNKGYFIKDNPNVILGINQEGISKLLGSGVPVYNEMYVNLAQGVSPKEAISELKSKFPDFDVKLSNDNKYVKEQVDTIVAPMYIAGPIVVGLAIVSFVLLLNLLNRGRKKYDRKLRQVGATKKQTKAIFLIEAFVMSILGSLIGLVLGIAVMSGIVGTTLKSLSTFKVNPIIAVLTPIVVTLLSILVISLMAIVSRKTPDKKQTRKYVKSKKGIEITTIVVGLLFIGLLIAEMLLAKAKPFLAVINFILIFILFSGLTVLLNSTYGHNNKEKNPAVKLATHAISSQKRHMSLSVGLVISILIVSLLFGGFGISKNIFKNYTKEFDQVAMVTNIRETTKEEDFMDADTTNAVKMYFGKGDIQIKNKKSSTLILGSKQILEKKFINFEWKSEQREIGEDEVVLDDTKRQLYGLKIGDQIQLTVGDKTKNCKVVGFVKHTFFAGNYVIINTKTMESKFGQKANTVLLKKSDKVPMDTYMKNIRTVHKDRNYYAVPALDAFRWETSSTNSILNFMGIIATVVGIFTLLLILSMSYMERDKYKNERKKLLQVGITKKQLLRSEIFENLFTVSTASMFAILGGLVGIIFMTDALRFLGMLFDYMIIWWIPLVVAMVFILGYSLAPIVMKYKDRYNIRR